MNPLNLCPDISFHGQTYNLIASENRCPPEKQRFGTLILVLVLSALPRFHHYLVPLDILPPPGADCLSLRRPPSAPDADLVRLNADAYDVCGWFTLSHYYLSYG